MTSDDHSAHPKSNAKSPSLISWPPPGLETIQGRLWEVTRQVGLGGAILVIPLLWSMTPDRGFSDLGPFGDQWQVLGLVTLAGLLMWIIGLAKLDGLLRAWVSATRNGYGWMTVAQVAADGRKDAGFLLQGAKRYANLDAETRRRIVVLRLWTAATTAAAASWTSVGFIFAVLLATRGVLGPTAVEWITIAPVVVLLLVALGCRIAEAAKIWATRRSRGERADIQPQPRDDVAAWNANLERLGSTRSTVGGRVVNPRAVGWSRVVAPILAGVVVVTSLTLVIVQATHTILVAISVPGLSTLQLRAANAEALRPHRLPADRQVTAAQAGEALQVLEFVGREREPHPLENPPVRTYDSPWFTAEDWGPFGISGAGAGDDWQEELFSRVAAGLSADERAFLREVAGHPAHREIETLARAAEADVAAARWVTPFPDTVSIIALPIGHIAGMRDAMSAHVGKAALEFSQGRRQQAETTIREVISAGFLMADESPTLIANMLGITATEIGGDALEAFYAASGRARDLEAVRFARDLAKRTAEVSDLSGSGLSVQGALLQLQAIVQDTLALRGLRWELLASINSYGPCLNLNKIVFGAGRMYDEWLEGVRESLVRWPGEEELFELARYGYLGRELSEGPGGGSWLQTIANLALSKTRSTGQCTAVFGAWQWQGVM